MMATKESTADKPWFWHPTRNRIQVKDLRAGDVITGTGPSGDFETGPVTVKSIVSLRKLGAVRVDHIINIQEGGSLAYWGDTVVEITARPKYRRGEVIR